MANSADRISSLTFSAAESTLRFLCGYHDYQVFGFEHIPRTGPALLAFHHSLATYDSFLLGVPMKDRLGRIFKGLADRLIFRTPVLSSIFRGAGFVLGTREATRELLASGELIGLAPGGMREALRSSREKYTFDWTGRYGFVRMSMLSGAPIILAACPRADDLYTVLPNPITPRLYERLRVPVPLCYGRAGTLLPRRLKLWHLLSEPIFPPVVGDDIRDEDVIAHHATIVRRMQRLMTDSLAIGASPSRPEDAPWKPFESLRNT